MVSPPDKGGMSARRFGFSILTLFGGLLACLLCLTPSVQAADDCPNAEIRAQQGASHLLDCRAYELVSPVDTGSQAVNAVAISPDNERAFLSSGGAFAGSPSQDGIFNNYLSTRALDGWTTSAQNLSATTYFGSGERVRISNDGRRSLLRAWTWEQQRAGQMQFLVRDEQGNLSAASPVITRQTASDSTGQFVDYLGGADDLSTIVFETSGASPVLPGEPVVVGNSNIYEAFGTGSVVDSVRRVDVGEAGEPIRPACPRRVGSGRSKFNAVSGNGGRIFFSARSQSASSGCSAANRGPMLVYARTDGTSTTQISKSQCTRVADPAATPPVVGCAPTPTSPPEQRDAADAVFEGASRDGQSAFFTSNRQLANSDTDATIDLYEYRFAPPVGEPTLTQVSAAGLSSPTPGNGARVVSAVRISEDGRRVYFVAGGLLTTQPNAMGKTPTDGASNLYAFERTASDPDGRVRFVATLAPSDQLLWQVDNSRMAHAVGTDARQLVFASDAQLTDDDADSATDIYRFDAVSGQIERISRAASGFGSNGNGEQAAQISFFDGSALLPVSPLSADGRRIVFGTKEALHPDDVDDASSYDLYEWADGEVALVTSGADSRDGFATYLISPDGSTILFKTSSRLVSEDVDDARSIYAARMGGGFLRNEPEPEVVCGADACQGPLTARPVLPDIGSVSFSGDGNVPLLPDRVNASVGVSKLKAVSGSAAKLKVRVPAAGRISVAGSSIRRTNTSASKAGTYSVKITLSSKAKKKLRKKEKLKVNARVSYRAKDGRSASKTISITFKQSKAKRAKAKKGGR
jgi:hypothetical protein